MNRKTLNLVIAMGAVGAGVSLADAALNPFAPQATLSSSTLRPRVALAAPALRVSILPALPSLGAPVRSGLIPPPGTGQPPTPFNKLPPAPPIPGR